MKQLFTILVLLLGWTNMNANGSTGSGTLATPIPAPAYSGGNGLLETPYQISTLTDLQYLSEHSADWSLYFIQTADINATATSGWNSNGSGGFYGFSPIGNSTTNFTGNYDGQNHTISNLYINRPATDNIGLFGYVYTSGSISNLGLTNVNVSGKIITGGLVGEAKYCTISNVYTTGTVVGNSIINSNCMVGGLVGYTWTYCTISNSYSKANVTGLGFLGGGLVGYNSGTIISSYATGSVGGDGVMRGGLVGTNVGNISKSYATGVVEGTGDERGGLAGRNEKNITDCYAKGNVSGANMVGGLVGHNLNNLASISNCYAIGSASGTNAIGGLVGNNNNGAITKSYSAGFVSGSTNKGGMVGSNNVNNNDGFWDTQTSGQALSSGGLGKTTAEMKTKATFLTWTWNFTAGTGVWYIKEAASGYISYPYLQAITYDTPGASPAVNPIPGLEKLTYSGGTGTSGDPYHITDWEQLHNISLNLSSYFVLDNDLDASSTGYASFASATANSNAGWAPLATFSGNFNGNNHTIDGLNINRSGSDNIGLFGYSTGTISNVGLINVTVSGRYRVGGLVGFNYTPGSISNVYTSGSVTSVNGDCGGLVGINSYASITNAYSTASVTGADYYGGLVGTNWGGTINKSYSAGSVPVIASHSGGLVGGVGDGGTTNNSFWDTQTSGQASSAGGTGKTTYQMKTLATFTAGSWDFTAGTGVWTMVEASSGFRSYPYFQSFTYDTPGATPAVNPIPGLSPIPAVEVSATLGTIGPSPYLTLKAAFDAINFGTHKGVITITINASTTEASSAVLYYSGYSPTMAVGSGYTSITIYPTVSGLSISGNQAAPLIDLNGADNVTIDGRVNATGSTKDLIITNTSTSATSETSTIRFINDASSNTVGYCTIKGSSTTVSGGVIYFSTSTGSTGNDNNTINLNDITNAADANRPINAIGSIGSSGKENSGNTISNNNIYDFCNRSTLSYGINLGDYNTAWSITGNSLYETASFVPTASVNYMGINIYSLGGNGFIVSNNFIGGQSSSCSGSAWTKTAATSDNAFTAIKLNVGTGTATSVQGNTIRNFSYANNASGNWFGIMVEAGDVNIGTTSANTIGAPTGNASINFSTSAIGIFYGIFLSTEGTVVVHDNIIGAITTSNTNSGNAINIYGISSRGGGNRTISNNTIGSTDAGTSNSIYAASPSTSASQNVFGIYSLGTGNVSISGNMVSKLTNGSTNSNISGVGLVKGIATTSGINTISGNTVRDLSIANANNSTSSTASVIGICQTSTAAGQTISGNTIYNLSNTNSTSVSPLVTGIYYSGGTTGTNVVSGNFVHSLSVASSNYGAGIMGLKIIGGTTTFANNIITLGSNLNGDYSVNGINEECPASNDLEFYFNTVYLGGNAGVGSQMTHAFISISSENIKNIRNNIIVNARTGTTLKRQCAIRLQSDLSLPGLTIDNNDYYAPNTGGVMGKRGPSFSFTTLADWQGFTGQDTHSLNTDPAFASAGGTLPENYLPSATTLNAATGTGITTDYDETTRSTSYPSMGAHEYTVEAPTPTTQAYNIVFSNVLYDQMTVSWTNGNGDKRAVFVKEETGTITNTLNNTTYTASADWSSKGTQLGTSGYYCVYNGSSNTVDLTQLNHGATYYVQVFEYNGPALGEQYNTTTATNNPKSQATMEAYFSDGTNYYSTWSSMIAGVSGGSTITLLSAYNCDANVIVTNSFTLDLNGFSITNTGNYTTEIADGKSFNLKNTGVGGIFNGLLSFAGSTSTFGLFSESVLGAGFTVSATSPASGILQIGDGTTALIHTYTMGDVKFNNKISKIVVKSSANLILNPLSD